MIPASISAHLICHSVEASDLRQREVPGPVGRAVDVLRVHERLVVVQPLGDGLVLLLVELHLKK